MIRTVASVAEVKRAEKHSNLIENLTFRIEMSQTQRHRTVKHLTNRNQDSRVKISVAAMAEGASFETGSEGLSRCFHRRVLLENRFELSLLLAHQLMSCRMFSGVDSVRKQRKRRASNRQSCPQRRLVLVHFDTVVLATTNTNDERELNKQPQQPTRKAQTVPAWNALGLAPRQARQLRQLASACY